MSLELFDQKPWFFHEEIPGLDETLDVGDFSYRHMKTLRVDEGTEIIVVDGKGGRAHAVISRFDKRGAQAVVEGFSMYPPEYPQMELLVSLTKSSARNEWLFEKATELGVALITPLRTDRSQKVHLKRERIEKILKSAMIQSRRYYLPILAEESSIEDLAEPDTDEAYLLAHCYDSKTKINISNFKPQNTKRVKILIGPEGDFTHSEVQYLIDKGAQEVFLGNNRLRTETAAILGLGILGLKFDKSKENN